MVETGLIFAQNAPRRETGQFLLTPCTSIGNLLFFNRFSEWVYFPKKILTCSCFDYILGHFEAHSGEYFSIQSKKI